MQWGQRFQPRIRQAPSANCQRRGQLVSSQSRGSTTGRALAATAKALVNASLQWPHRIGVRGIQTAGAAGLQVDQARPHCYPKDILGEAHAVGIHRVKMPACRGIRKARVATPICAGTPVFTASVIAGAPISWLPAAKWPTVLQPISRASPAARNRA